MSEIKLLPCPFCGGEAQLIRDRIGLWRVGCKKCNCMTTYQFDFGEGEEVSQKKAANVWNTRKPMERIVGRIQEVAENYCNAISCEDNPHGLTYKCRGCDHYCLVKTIIEIVKGGAE